MIDNGATVNLMTLATYKSMEMGQERLVQQSTPLTSFNAGIVPTIGHIVAELQVGPIRSPTRFHVIDADTSYHLLLGRPWIHEHKCVPSSLHQCLKISYMGKEITIRGVKSLFFKNKTHYTEVVLFDELGEGVGIKNSRVKALRLPQWREYENHGDPDFTERTKIQKVQRIPLPDGRAAYRLWRCTGPIERSCPIAIVTNHECKE